MAYGNQTLGRGELHFSLFKTDTFTPAGFRYLGNSPDFSVGMSNQSLDHYGSDHGIKEKDKTIVLQTDSTGKLTLDDIQYENLALFFFGSTSALAQSSATAVVETFVGVTPGFSYQLGIADATPTGTRSISNAVVKVASATKTVTTDYTVDAELGIITIVQGGGIAADATIEVTYDRAAKTRKQVVSGGQQIEGCLRFIAFNPEGEKIDYFLPYVKVSPNGDFALKGDTWQQLPMNVEILKAPNRERIYADGRPYTP